MAAIKVSPIHQKDKLEGQILLPKRPVLQEPPIITLVFINLYLRVFIKTEFTSCSSHAWKHGIKFNNLIIKSNRKDMKLSSLSKWARVFYTYIYIYSHFRFKRHIAYPPWKFQKSFSCIKWMIPNILYIIGKSNTVCLCCLHSSASINGSLNINPCYSLLKHAAEHTNQSSGRQPTHSVVNSADKRTKRGAARRSPWQTHSKT